MALGSPVKRVARRGAAKGPLERAGLAGLVAAAVAAAALLALLCAASLRCSAAAAPGRLWAGGVSIAAEAETAAAAAAEAAGLGARTRRKVAAAEAGVGGEVAGCDLFDGEWVRAGGGYPLYDSRDCPFLDVGFRCSENGRPDASYTKWRWQPTRCDLPRLVG
jgi:hypothetical protein